MARRAGRREWRELGSAAILVVVLAVVALAVSAVPALAFEGWHHDTATSYSSCTPGCHDGHTSTGPSDVVCTKCHTGFASVPGNACWTCHDPGEDTSGLAAATACTGTCHILAPSDLADPCDSCHQGSNRQSFSHGTKPHASADSAPCLTCHSVSVSATDPGGSPHHGAGAPTGGDDCASCHNGTDASLKVSHANTTCTDCHTGMDIPTVPATCNKCHTAASFGTGTCTSASCHGTSVIHTATPSATKTCTACHANKSTGHFETLGTCTKCHTEASGYHHLGGQTIPLGQCATCHDGTIAAAPVGHEGRGTNCTTCHTGMNIPSGSGDCASCHNGTSASLKVSHAGSTTCTSCHNGMDIPVVPATCNKCHAAASFGTGACTSSSCHGTSVIHTATPSAKKICTDCHTGKATGHYEKLGTCTKCHTNVPAYHHAGAKAIPLGQCRSCHDGTIATNRIVHDGSAGCTVCHSGMDIPAVPVKCNQCHIAPWYGTSTCNAAGCHGTDVIHDATPDVTPVCTDCHTGKATGHYEKLGTCTKCHADIDLFHHQGVKATPLAQCAACHDGKIAAAPVGHEGRGTNCTACHTGMNIPSGGGDCASCHNGTSASLKVGHDGFTQCATCHNGMDRPAQPVVCKQCHFRSSKVALPTCTTCHSAAGMFGREQIHTATPSAGKTCSSCHQAHYVDLGACASCHPQAPEAHHGLVAVTRSTLTLKAGASALTYGGSTTLQGVLSATGSPLPLEKVALQAGEPGSSVFVTVATLTTGPDGSFLFTAKPAANTAYRAVWKGTGATIGVQGAIATAGVDVRPKVGLGLTGEVSHSGKYSRYPLGRVVKASGKVSPNHAVLGNGSTKGSVRLTVYRRGYSSATKQWTWAKAKTVDRLLDAASRYAWSWKPGARGAYRLVTRFSTDGDHLAAKSTFRYFKVY